ncbi:MAG: STAS domain-containing protein [Acidimicrobiia bacterium]|nr:STAS domain-containing protein [Acidimicrobiia bacterium]
MPVARVHEQGARIVVSGEIDASTAHRITELVDLQLEEQNVVVRLDLRDTSFCDSAGLVTLLDCRAAASNRGARLVLVSPSDAVLRLLELTGLEPAFETEPG